METRANILVIRLKSIGDVLFTLPAVHALRENYPGAKITFLTSRENASLLRGFREVDETIALDRARLQSGNPIAILQELGSLLRRLRAGRFSLVVDFQGYGETAWLAWWSGAPERWGSVYRAGRQWAYTRGVPRNPRSHHADGNLSLLQQCGLRVGGIRNDFSLPEDVLAVARQFFTANNLDSARPVLFLQPFTSTPMNNWPLENYLSLAQYWRDRGAQVIVSGGPADQPLLDQARKLGFVVPTGLPRLADAGLMKLSTLIVGGDTGFLHLAVALGKRVVMLIHQVTPGSPVPFQHPEWAVAPPPGLPLAQVKLEQVIEATGAAMAATPKN